MSIGTGKFVTDWQKLEVRHYGRVYDLAIHFCNGNGDGNKSLKAINSLVEDMKCAKVRRTKLLLTGSKDRIVSGLTPMESWSGMSNL